MKRLLILSALVVLLTALGACASAVAPTAPVPTVAPTAALPTAAPSVAPAATPLPAPTPTPAAFVTLTDGAGRSVTIPKQPARVVSLAPSTTEILFAIGQGGKVTAVDDLSDYPAAAKNLPKLGGFKLNFEQIVAQNPDVVFAAGGLIAPDSIKKLEELKLTTVVVGSAKTTMESVMEDIRLVGRATGASMEANTVADAMRRKLEDLTSKGKVAAAAYGQPKVYWELDATDPSKPFAVGPGNFIADMIALAGGKNVFANASSPFAQVSGEQVLAANPEVIILSDAAYGVTVASVKERKGWGNISAVQKGRVYPIDDNLVSRPGPRVVEGLEAAFKLIHPDVFK
jgi:iron complex transport system substrate-binding protein